MTLPIKLESIHKGGTSQIAIVDRGVISIGRSKENAISVDSTSVSRFHGEFICTGSHWVYRDLGSTNGTSINSVRMQPGHLKLLKDRDMVSFSNFHIGVSYLSKKPTEVPNSIVVFCKDQFYSEYIPRSNADTLYAGGGNSDITIAGENSALVQFSIQFQNDAFSIQMFQISAPVLINGEAVSGFTQLYDLDEIQIGDHVILINSQRRTRAVAPSKQDAVKPELEEGALYSFEGEGGAARDKASQLVLDTKVTTKVSKEDVSAAIESAADNAGVSADGAPAADRRGELLFARGGEGPGPDEKRKTFSGNIEPIEKRAPADDRRGVSTFAKATVDKLHTPGGDGVGKKQQKNPRTENLILLVGMLFLVLMLCMTIYLIFGEGI